MRRTTWLVLGVGLLALPLALGAGFAASARADDLGTPPAGVAGPDDLDGPDAPDPMAPLGEAPAEDDVPAYEGVPYEAPLPDPVVDPYAPRSPEMLPPMPPPPPSTGGLVYPSYSAVITPPLAAPMRSTPGCCQPRDACGWALDGCGRRLGRWDVLIEGSLTCLDSPCGRLGEPVPAGTPTYEWNENDYCLGFGGRLTVSWRPSPRERLEVRGGYLGTWDDSSQQTGAFGFAPPAGGVSAVGPATLESEAELYGAEVNYWHELCCRGRFRFDAGIGVRYVHFDETATVRGLPLPTGAGSAFLQSEVESDLLAAQFALATYWDVAPRWEIGLLGKGFVGRTSTETEVNDVSVLSGGPHAASAETADFGWGFEVEGRVLYRITPRIGVTVGAAALYLGDQGRAHDAFDFSQAGTGAVQVGQADNDLFAVTLLVGLHLNF